MIPPDLIEQAACAGADNPDAWFPDKAVARDVSLRYAKRVCQGCTIRLECLEEGLAFHEHGVWGGTTVTERAQMLGVRSPRLIHQSGPTQQGAA